MGTVAFGEPVSWSYIEEESIFEDERINHIVNLTEIPRELSSGCSADITGEQQNDFDSHSVKYSANNSAKELQSLFVTQKSEYAMYFLYRLRALEKLWRERHNSKRSANNSRTTNSKGLQLSTVTKNRAESAEFSSHISLLLLIPLIKSHSKIDSSLAQQSTHILFQCLKDCKPNSLRDEPLNCVTGLADLLTGWLADEVEGKENVDLVSSLDEQIEEQTQNEIIIGCLVSLACAR